MSPIRIALALPHLGVYGGIRRFLELGGVWTRRGHEVAILVPEPRDARPWVPFSGAILPLAELPLGGWDTVLSPAPDLFLACRSPGALRVYYSVLEGAPEEDRALRAADLVLANSAGMRRYLARKGIVAEDAAGGVSVERFRPPAPDPRAPRRAADGAGAPRAAGRAADAGTPVRALVYGRLSRRRKGTWVAARAVERASIASGVPVAVTLFDAPPDGAETPSLPRPLRIPHRWVLNPTQGELADLYREADLFVSAERRAGWCNTAAEAMACGAAVVCTRSGTEDFAIDGVTASVARWRWTWALAGALAPLLRDPVRRAAIAARGLVKIQEYSWERTADRIERALEKRLGGRLRGQDAAQTLR
jgi:glycosyltransferase involved in cell wall biosynthesis